jgi:hypothetical protein
MRVTLALLLGAALSGCIQVMSSKELTGKGDTQPVGANCSSCHPYALKDQNHFYHIVYVDMYVKRVNGTVTCLDCHKSSLQYRRVTLMDSIYQDSAGVVRSLLDHPLWEGLREGVLIRVDTLVQNQPIPSPRVVPGEYEIQEWMTGLAHMNGRMEVEFDSSVTDAGRFMGARAEFNPQRETCSAISCHERPYPYRFAAPSKGLSGSSGAQPLPD